MELDSEEVQEAKIKAEVDGLPMVQKFQSHNEFFEDAQEIKNQSGRGTKEKRAENAVDAEESRPRITEALDTDAAYSRDKLKTITEKETKREEFEKQAQAVPIIENLNNFTYLVSINLSMIKVYLVDINRQKNSRTT